MMLSQCGGLALGVGGGGGGGALNMECNYCAARLHVNDPTAAENSLSWTTTTIPPADRIRWTR